MQILPILKSNPQETSYKFLYDFYYINTQASYYVYCNDINSSIQFKCWHQSGSVKVKDWINAVSDFDGKLNPEVLEFYRSRI